ncbi:MAG: ThuA domain-containing protein [Mediterranea sp.]|jgi:chitinase|nr:ThuA domain-containing protein [Mediterranea sp.]
MKRFTYLTLLLIALALAACGGTRSGVRSAGALPPVATPEPQPVVVAYVTSWSGEMPDPQYMTHINYAFGHVSETFDGVRVDNGARLHQIVALKQRKPALVVMLSIGGWGSGRFSEMAASDANRQSFAADCQRVVNEFGLDGIDIDWEYPTSRAADISASPDDTKNFTLLMRDIRAAIGPDKWLTLATVAGARYIDFKGIDPYVDLVNVMSYDMASAPKHHSALYPSDHSGGITTDEAVKAHLAAGVPRAKLVVGMPFYGRGGKLTPRGFDMWKAAESPLFIPRWDRVGKVPFFENKDNIFVMGYENARSLAIKCEYVKSHGLRGAMYWSYDGDNDRNELRATLRQAIIEGKSFADQDPRPMRVLVIAENGGHHVPFSNAGLRWLERLGERYNLDFTRVTNARPIVNDDYLAQFGLIVQLDFVPYTWPEEAQRAFIKYIDEGRGAWIGFHHATLLGNFDGYPMWPWFSDFMGGITYRNYIAPLATGTVRVEDATHPVMKGVPARFDIPDDEWYTFDKSPRPNVRVLANVDESSYTPASDIKMGDHPVVWTNESKRAKNVYFLFGHSPKLFDVDAFTTMFENAIRWTTNR